MCWPVKWRSHCDHRYVTSLHRMYMHSLQRSSLYASRTADVLSVVIFDLSVCPSLLDVSDHQSQFNCDFRPTVHKTVRLMLSDRCLSVCPVCPLRDVGILCPNGWMDQYETWHGGRPRPWPHCVRWGPSPLPQKGAEPPHFRTMSIVNRRLKRIKMPLGVEVALGPGHIVLDGDPAPPSPMGHIPQFSANICCGRMAWWIKMLLGKEVGQASA